MSRCFPFPPPGYQPPGHHAAARTEPLDSLAKEKHKERKHKKDKKDGEKKDKDRSKDKHKEKKDRKEKHRDKKKDKDKSKTSDDRKTEDRSEGHYGVKDNGLEDQGSQDSKFREELGRRIRDEEKGPSNSTSESFPGSIHRRTEGMVTAPAMENHRISGTEMTANSISKSVKRNNGMGLPVDEFAGSSQKLEGMGSATGMENERGTGNKSVGSMQERSQGRSLGSKEKERSAIKVSNAIGAMVPRSIGTEQTKNYTVEKPGGSIQERLESKFLTSDARERGATKVSNNIGTVVPIQEQRKDYRQDRLVDPISPMTFEGIRPATALGKEKVKSNTMVSHPFDPIEGRNDGIGDRAENFSPSFQSATEKGRGSQMSANLTAMEQKRNDGTGGSVRKDLDSSMEGKKTRDREADASKVERHRDGDKNEKKSKKDKDRHKEKKKEKERTKERGEHKHKQDSKLRDKEKGESKHKEDAKLRDKEKGDNKHKEDAKLRDNGKRDMLHSMIKPLAPQKEIVPDSMIKPLAPQKAPQKEIVPDSIIKPLAPQKAPQKEIVPDSMIKPLAPQKNSMFDSMTNPLAPQKDIANNAAAAVMDGNINKRKDIKINGFLHENVARPTKIMRTSLPSNIPLENGRALESYPVTGSSGSHGALNAAIARVPDNKEHKSNGIKESRPTPVDLQPQVAADTKVSAVTKVALKPPHPDKVAAVTKVAAKPPHPDLKYLDQVYTVPKMEEWPEFDEQEWLFSRDDIRPKTKTTIETEETPLVWAEAMQIDDVLALPVWQHDRTEDLFSAFFCSLVRDHGCHKNVALPAGLDYSQDLFAYAIIEYFSVELLTYHQQNIAPAVDEFDV